MEKKIDMVGMFVWTLFLLFIIIKLASIDKSLKSIDESVHPRLLPPTDVQVR